VGSDSNALANFRDVFGYGHGGLHGIVKFEKKGRGRNARANQKLCLRAASYMMAVGGAGSSGRPALASGSRIITATNAARASTLVNG
jgi:hypothetical protein